MVLYNVTLSVEDNILEDWLSWLNNEHIPKVMQLGFFQKYRILKLLNEVEEGTGTTIAVQYECDSVPKLAKYLDEYVHSMQEEYPQRYDGRIAAFRTMLEEI